MAGALGGRRIAVPPRNTRPTSDRTREAVFNLLAARLEFAGSSVLDLYAGSGAMGLEALSRGVDRVTFVEADPRAAAVIDHNIASLDVDGAVVVRRKVAALLAAGSTRPFELVFADPPYDIGAAEVDEMLMVLSSRGWTTAGTIVVVERRVSSAAVTWPPGWSAWPTRRYGDTRIALAQAVG